MSAGGQDIDDPRTLLTGLGLPEGPRWAGDRLYFADVWSGDIVALDLEGRHEVLAHSPNQPNGMAILPDGRLLVATMLDRRLWIVEAGGLTETADLSALVGDLCNDMIADQTGHAYVGGHRYAEGPDRFKPENGRGAPIVMVDFSAGATQPPARIVADDLFVPNGMAVTADGRTLIVAESARRRLTAFAIDADGGLSDRRLWAQLDAVPDGICLDAEGCVWVASAHVPAGFQRVAEGGAVLDRIDPAGYGGFTCVLGGPDRRTLFLLEAPYPTRKTDRGGRIRTVRLPVPGAGLP